MIYKDLITLIIIFFLLLALGVRIAEQGLYETMGLDLRPKSFDFDFQRDRVYSFTILGNSLEVKKILSSWKYSGLQGENRCYY